MELNDGLMEKIAIIDASARDEGDARRSVCVFFTPGTDGKPGALGSAVVVCRESSPTKALMLVDAEFVTFGHADPQSALDALVQAIQGASETRADRAAVTAKVTLERKDAVAAEAGKLK